MPAAEVMEVVTVDPVSPPEPVDRLVVLRVELHRRAAPAGDLGGEHLGTGAREELEAELAGLRVVRDGALEQLERLLGRVHHRVAVAADLPDGGLLLVAEPGRLVAADPAEVRALVPPVVHPRAGQEHPGLHPDDVSVEYYSDRVERPGEGRALPHLRVPHVPGSVRREVRERGGERPLEERLELLAAELVVLCAGHQPISSRAIF